MVKWIIIFPIALLIIGFLLLRHLFREPDFHKPTGRYSVGTHHFELFDKIRNRRISFRVFYPVDTDQTGSFLPVMDTRVSRAFSKMYHIPGGGKPSPSNSIIDAPVSERGAYPVTLFSHGAFSFDTQNLSTMEELASHGFIAFTISHTDEALLTIFPDGETAAATDSSFIQNSMKMSRKDVIAYKKQLQILKSDSSDEQKLQAYKDMGENFYRELEPYLKTRVADVHFLLASLNELNSDQSFPGHGQMNLERIGMFGHSFGGITASYICSEEDTPVRAGINMDAPVLTYRGIVPQLKRPFSFFYSTQTSLMKEGKINMTGTNSYYAENSENSVYSLSFEGTGHYNFSDFNFMPPFFRYTPMLGSINGLKMSEIMNRSVLEFFNQTLKDDKDNFYTSGVSPFIEVDMQKN